MTVFNSRIYFILNREDALDPAESSDSMYTGIASFSWIFAKSTSTGSAYTI